jgi:amino acid transporter
MAFNVVFSIALIFTGGAVEIYSLSNVGYTASFIPVLVGYYLLRNDKAEARRPVRLPEFFKYIALFLAGLFFVIWLYGGIVYTSLPNALLDNSDTRIYYFIGWALLVSYVFFYWYRVKVEDPKRARDMPDTATPAATAGD